MLPFRPDVLSITIALFTLASLAYNASLLKNKRLFRLSFFFIIYSILLPSVTIILLYSYTQSLVQTSPASLILIPDKFLEYSLLLAMVFTYSGNMIHIATKSLANKGLRNQDTEASQFNHYLHFSFSHNLIYCGILLIILSLSLLELNHVSTTEYNRWVSPILRGIALGILFISAMYRYTLSGEEIPGRWSDLKAVFALAWIAVVLIGYTVIKSDVALRDHPLVFPSLLGFSLINLLNVGLAVRHVHLKRRNSVQ